MQVLSFDIEKESWMLDAACSFKNSDLFFPVGSSMKALKQSNEAIAICNECPVKIDCLEYAINTNQDSGIWGGTTEEERKNLRRQYKKTGFLINYSVSYTHLTLPTTPYV